MMKNLQLNVLRIINIRTILSIVVSSVLLINSVAFALSPQYTSGDDPGSKFTQKTMQKMAEMLFIERNRKGAIVNALKSFLSERREEEYLIDLSTFSNRLNKKVARLSEDEKPEAVTLLKKFYKTIIKNSLKVKDKSISEGLQIMAAQTMNIITWINSDEVPDAEKLQVTHDPALMLKAKDRGPSYLELHTFPVNGADNEGDPGIYYRGVEYVSKMGDNILEEAIYDKEEFDNVSDKTIMYLMEHGFMKVPVSMEYMTEKDLQGEQELSTIHETFFMRDYLPGSNQHTSTGPGHFQGTKLDMKYVTEGEGIQYNKFYNEKGELIAVYAQYLRPGTWTMALPGAVDSMGNIKGLRFNDFSVEVPKDQIDKMLKSVDSGLDLSKMMLAGGAIKEGSKVNPYILVDDAKGKPVLIKNIDTAPKIYDMKDANGNIFKESLREVYSKLVPDNIRIMTDHEITFIAGSLEGKELFSSPIPAADRSSVADMVSKIKTGEVIEEDKTSFEMHGLIKELSEDISGITGEVDTTIEGPGKTDLWEALVPLKSSKIDIFIPRSFKLTDGVRKAVRDINKSKGTKINLRMYTEYNLMTLLSNDPDGFKRIIITDKDSREYISSKYVESDISDKEKFKGVRLLNMVLPEKYSSDHAQTAYLARSIMIAVLARLLEKGEKSTPKIEMVLRYMLKNALDPDKVNMDRFMNELAAEENDLSYFLALDHAVSLIEMLENELHLTREFWTYA